MTFQYDGANRVTRTTQSGGTISYVYNIPGRTRTLTYPGGRTLTENTDARGRLGTINDAASPIVQYAYDLGNRVASRSYRNGTTASYTYNANDWVLSLDHTTGGSRIAGFTYDFDPEGNKRFEQKLHDPGDSEAFQYDLLYRVIDFRVGNLVGSTVPVPVTQAQYNLASVGNWKTKVQDGVPENRTHSVTNEITQIGAVPVLSDFNGNTSEDKLYRYFYDEEDRLTAVIRKADGQAVGQYRYDALSRRIAKSANPAAGNGRGLFLAPTTASASSRAARWCGNARHLHLRQLHRRSADTMDKGSQTYYYHQNSLWSVEAITDSRSCRRTLQLRRHWVPHHPGRRVQHAARESGARPRARSGNAHGRSLGGSSTRRRGVLFPREVLRPGKGEVLQRDPMEYVDGMNLYAGYFVPNSVDPEGTRNVKPARGGKHAIASSGSRGGSMNLVIQTST